MKDNIQNQIGMDFAAAAIKRLVLNEWRNYPVARINQHVKKDRGMYCRQRGKQFQLLTYFVMIELRTYCWIVHALETSTRNFTAFPDATAIAYTEKTRQGYRLYGMQ
jgi:hypothetical protein